MVSLDGCEVHRCEPCALMCARVSPVPCVFRVRPGSPRCLFTTGHTGHTGARITQTNLTTIQTQRHTRTTTRRPKPRPTQQPQARSRPLPRSPRPTQKRPPPANQTLPPPAPIAPPRACSKAVGEMKARAATRNGLTAGGAARAPDKLETREAEAGMRNGRGEADLGAQRRDHEGSRIEHGAGAK